MKSLLTFSKLQEVTPPDFHKCGLGYEVSTVFRKPLLQVCLIT